MDAQAKKPAKRPTKIEELTKEQVRQAIVKKRECNSKAQRIVESLLDKHILEDYFLKCLPDINQTHLEDVIEERSILHLCGYPLCHKTLSEKDIPKQKYRISMKTNKVYDITARKSFCSNICYKSAMHVKKQMLTSPLWFRDYEKIPVIYLLPFNSVGSMGQEIDLSLTEKIVSTSDRQTFTSVNDFANTTLNEVDDNKNSNNTNNNQSHIIENANNIFEAAKDNKIEKIDHSTDDSSNNISTDCNGPPLETTVKNKFINLNTNTNKIGDTNDEQDIKPIDLRIINKPTTAMTSVKETQPVKNITKNPLNIVGDVIEKAVKPVDPILVYVPQTNKSETKCTVNNKKLPQKKQPSIAAITIEVEKCLAEWFTIDTLLFIFGEDKVKEMVAYKGECIKDYLNNYSKHISYSSNTYDQYQALCKKLKMLELEDKRFDLQTLGRESKPLPDYSILKEESKKMQLKVKAFFSAQTEIPIPNETSENTDENIEEENKTQLPLVDKNAQNALRRRIVCKHLNKVLPDILRSLGLYSSISSDICLLVNTFKLKANNIMFKPIQWTLIAIVFIKLLSLRNSGLKILLEQPMAFQHMQLMLLSYKQDGGYLDRLISWLTDIDRLLDVNDTQLTVE